MDHPKTMWQRAMRSLFLGGFLTAASMSAPAVEATIITSGCASQTSCTLQELVNGGTMTVNDKVFDGFRVTENSVSGVVGGRTAVNLNHIVVTGLDAQALSPGLAFTALNQALRVSQQSTTPTAELDLDFVFRAHSLLGPTIHDNTLAAVFGGTAPQTNPFQTDHFAEVRERLFRDGGLTQAILDSLGVPIEKDVHRDVDTSVGLFDDQSNLLVSKMFDPLEDIWILKDLRVQTASAGEFAEILSFEQQFSQIPEPGTWLLMSTGLFGMVGYGWWRKRTV